MNAVADFILIVAALALVGMVVFARAKTRVEREATKVTLDAAIRQLNAYDADPFYAKPIQAWTPAEREALGIDDTERFIRETDAALRAIEDHERYEHQPEKQAAWTEITTLGRAKPIRREPAFLETHTQWGV